MSRSSPSRRLALGALLALPLAACVETAGDFNPSAPPRARAPGVPVALVSLDGAPEEVTARLSLAISQQAARRDISIVGVDGKPRYLVRGHVSAFTEGGEGSFSWAFDIYDAQKKRARRVSGEERIRGGEAWSAVGDAQIGAMAARATDDLAEFLAAAPPAIAQGRGGRRAASLLAGN